MALGTIASEGARKAALGVARGRNISQQLRGGLLANNRVEEGQSDDQNQPESVNKSRLATLKAGAIKQANTQAGAAAGAAVGGTVGSVIPIIGTGIGAFIGRFAGKYLGITGIMIVVILMIIFFIIMFIVMLKAGCNKVYGAQWAIGLHDMCAALGE